MNYKVTVYYFDKYGNKVFFEGRKNDIEELFCTALEEAQSVGCDDVFVEYQNKTAKLCYYNGEQPL